MADHTPEHPPAFDGTTASVPHIPEYTPPRVLSALELAGLGSFGAAASQEGIAADLGQLMVGANGVFSATLAAREPINPLSADSAPLPEGIHPPYPTITHLGPATIWGTLAPNPLDDPADSRATVPIPVFSPATVASHAPGSGEHRGTPAADGTHEMSRGSGDDLQIAALSAPGSQASDSEQPKVDLAGLMSDIFLDTTEHEPADREIGGQAHLAPLDLLAGAEASSTSRDGGPTLNLVSDSEPEGGQRSGFDINDLIDRDPPAVVAGRTVDSDQGHPAAPRQGGYLGHRAAILAPEVDRIASRTLPPYQPLPRPTREPLAQRLQRAALGFNDTVRSLAGRAVAGARGTIQWIGEHYNAGEAWITNASQTVHAWDTRASEAIRIHSRAYLDRTIDELPAALATFQSNHTALRAAWQNDSGRRATLWMAIRQAPGDLLMPREYGDESRASVLEGLRDASLDLAATHVQHIGAAVGNVLHGFGDAIRAVTPIPVRHLAHSAAVAAHNHVRASTAEFRHTLADRFHAVRAEFAPMELVPASPMSYEAEKAMVAHAVRQAEHALESAPRGLSRYERRVLVRNYREARVYLAALERGDFVHARPRGVAHRALATAWRGFRIVDHAAERAIIQLTGIPQAAEFGAKHLGRFFAWAYPREWDQANEWFGDDATHIARVAAFWPTFKTAVLDQLSDGAARMLGQGGYVVAPAGPVRANHVPQFNAATAVALPALPTTQPPQVPAPSDPPAAPEVPKAETRPEPAAPNPAFERVGAFGTAFYGLAQATLSGRPEKAYRADPNLLGLAEDITEFFDRMPDFSTERLRQAIERHTGIHIVELVEEALDRAGIVPLATQRELFERDARQQPTQGKTPPTVYVPPEPVGPYLLASNLAQVLRTIAAEHGIRLQPQPEPQTQPAAASASRADVTTTPRLTQASQLVGQTLQALIEAPVSSTDPDQISQAQYFLQLIEPYPDDQLRQIVALSKGRGLVRRVRDQHPEAFNAVSYQLNKGNADGYYFRMEDLVLLLYLQYLRAQGVANADTFANVTSRAFQAQLPTSSEAFLN